MACYKNGRLHVENNRREDDMDRQLNRHATRKCDETDTSTRKDNSLTPHVNAVSKTATTSPATTSETAKEVTVTNTTPMLEREQSTEHTMQTWRDA